MIGAANAETLDGGAGNDRLEGGGGGGTYAFDAGYGRDRIRDVQSSGDPDRVEFGAGITPAGVAVLRDGDDLVFNIPGSADQLIVENQFYIDAYHVEEFHFDDGTVWMSGDVETMLIAGTPGDDRLTGFDAAETCDGGAGDDRLEGGGGGDTYLFDAGYGRDRIRDLQTSGDPDRVQFGAGIAPADAIVFKDGYDLIINISGTADRLIVENQF